MEKLPEAGLTMDILNVKNRNKLIEVFQSQNKPIPSQVSTQIHVDVAGVGSDNSLGL